MGAVRRIAIALLCLLVLPAAAWAVRPHASPVAQADYRGSDPEGPVSFHLTLAYNERIGTRPAFEEFSIGQFRFATECNHAGVRLPRNLWLDKKQRPGARIVRFTYRSHDIQIRVTLSGKYLGVARGSVRISTPRCDGDTLPFSASLAD